MPVHDSYGGGLPALTCVQLEENLAEKIARLNRTTTARDIYDLVWIWQTFRRQSGVRIDANLIRRLAVLKIWVDANGLSADGTSWKPGHEAFPFDPERWLRERSARDFDTEDIGHLAVPPPDLDELGKDLRTCYSFLLDLDADERAVADLHGGHRQRVLRMLTDLDGRRLAAGTCW
jgi:predicted nucleotidyltransferase component of viral defense system